ncbi:CoB--CoM heterodisulfide reductase iron-sulfur subunit A family protein, partial [Candidatus Aerophobetes bacterium]
DAELVVLATALIARHDATKLAKMLHIPYDQNRLFTEAHPKLAPVETVTTGVFLTGACQSPKDVPDTVATASAASVKACGLLSHDKLPIEPQIARVNAEICSGCLACKEVCPFGAIEKEEIVDKVSQKKRVIAKVTATLCNGCGACNTACRPEAIDLDGFTEEQIFGQIESLVADRGDGK